MRRDLLLGAAVFLLALAVRLAVIAQLQDEPLFRSPQLDGLEYLNWATRIAQGDFTWPEEPIHGPGYPFFVAAILAVTRSLEAVHVAQAIAGAAAAVLVFAIARDLYGSLAAASAGVLHAVCAPLVFLEVSFIAEGLLIALLVGALWTAPRSPAASGLLLGLAIIVRPTAAALVPLFLRPSGRTVLFVVALALPVVPVVVTNATRPDKAAGVQTSGGMNVYIGNSPLHDGTAWARPGGAWDSLRGMPWRAGVRGAANEDRYFLAQTVREISADPLAFARLVASKALWLTQDEELRDTHSLHFFAASSALLRALPGYGLVFALGITGLVLAIVERRQSTLVTGCLVLMALTVIALVAGTRYRAPVLPALFIYGGAAVAWLSARASRKDYRAVAGAAALFFALLAATSVRTHPPSHDASEELALTALALRAEGRIEAAAETARRAVAANPRFSTAWVALGDIEVTRGDWARAEHAWRQALAVDPNNVQAWSHLALAEIRRGNRARAGELLRRALSIRWDAEAAHNLSVVGGQPPAASK